MDSDHPEVGRSGLMLRRLPLVVPLLVVAVSGWAKRQVIDDGFIYFRVVQNVVALNGPVFNAGERVESYTSPTWLAILAVGDVVLPFRLEWIAVVLGLLLSIVGLAAAMDGALRLARGPDDSSDQIAVPAGALVFAAPFGVWAWYTAGMETGLVFAWLGGCLWLLARWATTHRSLGLGGQIVLGLGWLIRPELVMVSALFVLVVLIGEWKSTTRRASLLALVGMVAVPAAYQLFRMGYFGTLVANTALVKEGTSVEAGRGKSYLLDFTQPYVLWLPLLIMVVGLYAPMVRSLDARGRAVVLAFAGGSLIMAGWVVSVGGDYFHGRLLVPSFFMICAPVAAVPLQRRYIGSVALVPWAFAAIVILRPPQLGENTIFGIQIADANPMVTTEDWGWDDEKRGGTELDPTLYVYPSPFVPNASPVAFEVHPDLPKPAVVSSGIGLTAYGYGPDVYVFDTLGLANAVGSRFEIEGERLWLPGHEKRMPAAWVAAEVAAPSADVQAGMLGGEYRDVPIPRFNRDVDAARRALECPPLVRIDEATRGHLGPRRFLQNIFRSPSNTFMRIPMDPEDAVRELC
jgi:arabinofuranosyltransferase